MADWLARPTRFAAQMLAPTAQAAAASPEGAPPARPLGAYFDRDDPARRLAHLPASLEKFRSISEAIQSCFRLSRTIGDEIEELRSEESRLDSKISEFRNWNGDATTAIADAQLRLASVQERRARALRSREATGYAEVAPVARSLNRYLEEDCRHAVLRAYEGPAPAKLPKGESHADGIERFRREVSDVAGQIEHLETVGIPIEEAYRIGCAEIDGHAQAGTPSLAALIQFGGKIGWPESTSWAIGLNPSAVILPSAQIQTLELEAWHSRESMKAQLRSDLEKMLAGRDAMMPAQKAERRTALLLKKLQIERAEESLIESMPVPIARRFDADPRAILLLDQSAPVPES